MTQQSKVYYRPIEAAIRWSGLSDHERYILNVLNRRNVPEPDDFPEWPQLRLNAERIYDAILNRELRNSLRGVTVPYLVSIDHPLLSVRHVDLKRWMLRFYPEERPPFLFSEAEQRIAHPVLTAKTLRILLDEREALKLEIDKLHAERQRLLKREEEPGRDAQGALTPRAETTYLHLVGGLRDLLLGTSPSGEPYSKFKTQDAIISALVANFGGRLGLSERTIAGKFAAATKRIRG